MASFQAKKGRDRLRMWEKKILVLIHSNPTWNRESQKNSKKIQKIKKHQYGFFSSQNGTREAENVRKKKFSFWSIPNRPGIGNSKKIAKKLKKLKNINMASFQAKKGRERLGMWEKKILVLIHSNPTRNRELQKNSKKIQKIKKHHYGFFSSQNGTGQAENERKKNRSY